jgi:ABC-type molybdate transport system permease subunit
MAEIINEQSVNNAIANPSLLLIYHTSESLSISKISQSFQWCFLPLIKLAMFLHKLLHFGHIVGDFGHTLNIREVA